ncbi:hypothetical protein HPG69_004370 [Diceros bicornis minor]|uniref:Uncharacterized protein n=1 Tax=Diceros bicornis minor TaxID=77932 RepID=A0A7J7E6X0_DICBM|nr:hypothetical protein HPG69_004370 [Diceros bicornis minor]
MRPAAPLLAPRVPPRSAPHHRMAHQQIYCSDKYFDEHCQYRHALLIASIPYQISIYEISLYFPVSVFLNPNPVHAAQEQPPCFHSVLDCPVPVASVVSFCDYYNILGLENIARKMMIYKSNFSVRILWRSCETEPYGSVVLSCPVSGGQRWDGSRGACPTEGSCLHGGDAAFLASGLGSGGNIVKMYKNTIVTKERSLRIIFSDEKMMRNINCVFGEREQDGGRMEARSLNPSNSRKVTQIRLTVQESIWRFTDKGKIPPRSHGLVVEQCSVADIAGRQNNNLLIFRMEEPVVLQISTGEVHGSSPQPRSRGKTTVEDEDSMDGLETTETEHIVETVSSLPLTLFTLFKKTKTIEIKEQSAEEDAEGEVDNSKQPIPVLQRSVSEESASSLVSVGVEAKIRPYLKDMNKRRTLMTTATEAVRKYQTQHHENKEDREKFCLKAILICGPALVVEGVEVSVVDERSVKNVAWKANQLCSLRMMIERSLQQNIVSCVSVSTQTASDDQAGKLWDELSLVGLPDAIDVQALFDPTGTCWAHHRCMEWSLGVCQMEEPLVNVDKAVVSGSTETAKESNINSFSDYSRCFLVYSVELWPIIERLCNTLEYKRRTEMCRCAFCKHLGATIKCCEEKCTQMYHYPCAAGAGTFQDSSHCFLLCPEHIDQAPERYGKRSAISLDPHLGIDDVHNYIDFNAFLGLATKEDANCAVCDSPGDLLDQFFCTTCGQHYHGMCLDIAVTPLKRAGWQCPECKVCQNCKQSGEDSKMLVCDTCDKGYHTFCLQPVMKSVPTNGWKCKDVDPKKLKTLDL